MTAAAATPSRAPATSGLVIEQIDVWVLNVVPRRQRRIPTGKIPYGAGDSWIGKPVLVGIAAGGVQGFGEIRPINPFVGESATSMFPVIRDFFAPRLVGRDALRIDALIGECEKIMPGHPAACAAIDMALHDLVGKTLGVPVHALLGGACRERIPLEWSVGLESEDAMVREAAEAAERYGVKCVCVKVGPTDRLEVDVRVMTAVRKAVGQDVVLGMDANTTYNGNGAIGLARRLTDSRIGYFEQPVARTALSEMRRIRNAVECSVFADESLFTRQDAIQIVREEAADVLGLKFYKCGGLHRMREIASIAAGAALDVNCAGTTAGTYLEAIAAAHLAASIPNHAFGAEFIMGLPSVNGNDPVIANEPIDVVEGSCAVPMEPGLGAVIDLDAVKRLTLGHSAISRAL